MKRIIIFSTMTLSLALIVSFGCTTKKLPQKNSVIKESSTQEMEGENIMQSESVSITDFSLDFIRNTEKKSPNKNIFVSPISLNVALGMLINGTNESAKQEITKSLGLSSMSESDINNFYKNLVTEIPTNKDSVDINMSNSFWYKNSIVINNNYKKSLTDNFQAEIKGLDFNDSDKNIINNWVKEKTNNKIKEVVSSLNPSDLAILINTIYFKANWKYKFDENETKESEFYKEDGKSVIVNMMNNKNVYKYFENNNAEYLDIPYANTKYVATIVLPKKGNSISDVFKSLNKAEIDKINSSLSDKELNIFIPKTKQESTYSLKDVLINMGIKNIFQSGNLSKIADQNMAVSNILQSTYLAIGEDGTEAAAATKVTMVRSFFDTTKRFTCNKPYGVIIQDKKNGIVLFIGKIIDPT